MDTQSPQVNGPTSEPILNIGGHGALVFIGLVVAGIAVIAVIPLIIDTLRAAAWRKDVTDRLLPAAADNHEIRALLKDLREPRGVRGLTRSLIAVLVLALVGLALAVTLISSSSDSGDLRKTIVTALMTVLATVIGFYFGQLGAQNSAEDAGSRAQNGRSHPAAPPSVDDITPTTGAEGDLVTVTGTGLSGAVDVLFGTAAGTALKVSSDSSLSVRVPAVPADMAGKTVDVMVRTAAGRSLPHAGARFTLRGAGEPGKA